jgi:hypothetical protein
MIVAKSRFDKKSSKVEIERSANQYTGQRAYARRSSGV